MKEIITQLTKCKEITPRAGFMNVSRREILSERQDMALSFDIFFRPLYVGGFAALLLMLTLSYALFSATGPAYASLDMQNIQDELDDLTISIRLEEISYRESAAKTVASALQEITEDKFRHLNPRLLKNEEDSFELPEENKQIEELLNTVIF